MRVNGRILIGMDDRQMEVHRAAGGYYWAPLGMLSPLASVADFRRVSDGAEYADVAEELRRLTPDEQATWVFVWSEDVA